MNLAMCNCVAMGVKAACLVEIGFMTNEHEAELMKTDAFCKEQGEEVAKGVLDYLGINFESTIPISLSSVTNKVQESVNNTINKVISFISLSHFTNYVATQSSNLKIRTRSGNQFLETGKSLEKDTQIKAYDAYNGWVKIDAKENKWCSSKYISSNFNATVIGCSALKFRDSDSVNGKVLETLKSGEKVKLFAQSTKTDWVLTEYGWCNPDYLNIAQK